MLKAGPAARTEHDKLCEFENRCSMACRHLVAARRPPACQVPPLQNERTQLRNQQHEMGLLDGELVDDEGFLLGVEVSALARLVHQFSSVIGGGFSLSRKRFLGGSLYPQLLYIG